MVRASYAQAPLRGKIEPVLSPVEGMGALHGTPTLNLLGSLKVVESDTATSLLGFEPPLE